MSDLTFRGGNIYRAIQSPSSGSTHAESVAHFTDGDYGVYDWRAINAFANANHTIASNNPFNGWNQGADGVPAAHPGGNTAAQYLQWEIWAGASNPTHSAGGTAVYPSPYVTGLTQETWYSDKAITTASYTKGSGGTGYAFNVDGDSDFCLNSNSSDGATINANGGYTFFFGMYNYSPFTGTWGRPYNIYGFSTRQGNHIGGTNPGNYEYAGPLIFYNTNSGPYQIRRSASNSTYAGYSYFGIGGYNSTNNSMLAVIRVTTGGASKLDLWLGDHGSGTTYATSTDSTMNWAGATDYGVNTSSNSARPFFCDSQYWSNGSDPAYIHCAGIINHPLDATAAQDLLNGMKAAYT